MDEVGRLVDNLSDAIWRFRWKAADALGMLCDSRAVEPLISRVLTDEEWIVRWEAARALGKIRDPRALEPLVKASGDRNEDVRKVAAEALQKIIAGLKLEEKVSILCAKCICCFEEERAILTPFNRAYVKGCAEVLEEHRVTLSSYRFTFHTFCHRGHAIPSKAVAKVVVILDRSFKLPLIYKPPTLVVNWFKHKEPFDFDEIWIENADEFDIEELVMRLRNDMHLRSRKRLSSIPVYLALRPGFSQARLNLLQDTFHNVKTLAEETCHALLEPVGNEGRG